MRTRLTADYVIGFDGSSHVIWRNGEVVFSGDTIEFVGRGFSGHVDRTFDYGRALIGPGFIDLDALGDLDSTVLAFDNSGVRDMGRIWSAQYLAAGPRETYTPDEEIFKYRYAFTQLIANGITTALPITSMLYREWGERYEEFAAVAKLAAEMGLRTYLGPCYMSGMKYMLADGSPAEYWDEARGLAGLAAAERFYRDFDNTHDGLIRGLLAPNRIETCTPALLERTARVAHELSAPVRLHCCQSVYEFELVARLRGVSPLAWLEQAGLLNARAILPHGIFVSGHPQVSIPGSDDHARLAGSGATVAHCPIVFARNGSALSSFGAYRKRGIRIGLGTDTFPPDIIDNMRQGLNIARVLEGDNEQTSAADLYNAATLGGAAALGRDDIGRLAAGAKADIAVFDLSGFHMGQIFDPIKNLLVSGHGRDCRSSFINGRCVLDDYQVLGADYAALTQQADLQFEKLKASHADRAFGQPDPASLFQPSFPLMAS